MNAGDFGNFSEHRHEIERFSKGVAEGGPEFVAMSYPELWSEWDHENVPAWLSKHLGRLRERYALTIEA